MLTVWAYNARMAKSTYRNGHTLQTREDLVRILLGQRQASSAVPRSRQGFLADEQYRHLRDVLPDYLRPLFVCGYFTGVRVGELLALRWDQVDWEQRFITLNADETKAGFTRAIPILNGDMLYWLRWSQSYADSCPWIFHREGSRIKDFRGAWASACTSAGVPALKFHDLRRTAVRNMRRAGVPQVVRMRISGHRTDSMERRYNIVDVDDIRSARQLMEKS